LFPKVAVKRCLSIGVWANFFYGEAELFLPEKFFHSARKAAVLTANLQNYFARLTPPIISKKSRISDTRWNELRFLFKYNFFHFWLQASARKIYLLPEK